MKIKEIVLLLSLLVTERGMTQQVASIELLDEITDEPIAGATVYSNSTFLGITSKKGMLALAEAGDTLYITAIGYLPLSIPKEKLVVSKWYLTPEQRELDAVVVSGTLRPVRKSESPVNVEVYSAQFLKKNPSPSIFEALQNVNGVRPQLNCSVCNTGDIHINGLEGPYTMVTIDGMPIVSSLASVYGLFGIPSQMIDRVEIVKGPASGLYGSEAIGGLINVITKTPEKAPLLAVNMMTTSWREHSLDIGVKSQIAKKVTALTGINYFNYQRPVDNNKDGFTDVTLQHRISVFNKIGFSRKQNRKASIAARYFYEDRWGGEMNFGKAFRGTDSVYGESIYTNRWELMGSYDLPVAEKISLAVSATSHDQNSYYGTTPYFGQQRIAFSQLTWDKSIGGDHQLLTGLALRYNYYDDNSTATMDTVSLRNKPEQYVMPGIFVQDEWKLSTKHVLLAGLRYDYNSIHKNIFTPRIAWKWNIRTHEQLRLNAGTGFRVVNLFTEDHAALTGARTVVITEELKPEKSYNVNLNYTKRIKWNNYSLLVDATTWYTYFTNQILPDYDSNPQQIIYNNLAGYAASRGATLNIELDLGRKLKALVGATVQDVRKISRDEAGNKTRELIMLTEKWSGTWAITYHFPAAGISVDYTGNIYGPMRLPLLASTDPRPAFSPVWSIQNIQATKKMNSQWEFYGGVKNLLNWTPAKSAPFLIARSQDPFNKKVDYDPDGAIRVTPENPYGLSFDPSYVYAPNQGIRFFLGVRFTIQ